MRQIQYQYSTRGMYVTQDSTVFGGDPQLKLVVEPHSFSIAIDGEVLRSTSFPGCTVTVSQEGAVWFYDQENNLLGQTDKSDGKYDEVMFVWKPDYIEIQFGRMETVDYYPNCDGEYDRWGETWAVQRAVRLTLQDNSITIS